MSTKTPSQSKKKIDAKQKKGDQIEGRTKKTKSAPAAKPKRLSALDAAAQILKSTGKPMRPQELIEAMAEKGLWSSPKGKTPHATLSAAMQREIQAKAGKARFVKADRGLFAFNEATK